MVEVHDVFGFVVEGFADGPQLSLLRSVEHLKFLGVELDLVVEAHELLQRQRLVLVLLQEALVP